MHEVEKKDIVIQLSQEEMKKCREFAAECAKNQQQIEFGQSDTTPRGTQEISRDNLIGKMAEAAFARMMEENYGIQIELDFRYYPRGEWDDQDAVVNGWRIDVKGTRQGGKWMLVEWSKLRFRKAQNLLSHFYVMASVSWDRDTDEPVGTVRLTGYASLGQLKEGYPNTLGLRKGDVIPGTDKKIYENGKLVRVKKGTPLQADNFGRKFEHLEKDWDKFAWYLKEREAEDTSEWKMPES